MADEVTDSSNKEQLSLVIRYVDPDDCGIPKDLVDFIECDIGITGSALAEKIIGFLQNHGVDITKLRGQAYDGAGNMAGWTRGAASLITAQYPLALYLHCASQCLNLAVVKSLEETNIRNMMGVVDRISVFFSAHPKRQRKLEEALDTTLPESSIHKLKDLCCMRWVQHIDALNQFQTLHPSIVACMEQITTEGPTKWSRDSLTDARTLMLAITTTEFFSALVITNVCLGYLLGLTRSLQADIVEAVAEINHTVAALRDVHHTKWFASIEKMCQSVDLEPALTRCCGCKQHRSNVPAENPSEYYCCTISIPLVDHLLSELEVRFNKHQQTALQGLFLVASVLTTKSLEEAVSKISPLADMYRHDLPFPDSIESEIHCWHMKWQQQRSLHGQASLPTTPPLSLPHATSMFPNIKTLLLILCNLPVTSCSSERSFSGLKRIKTALRTTMGNERLTALSLLHINRDIGVDIHEVVDKFARRHPRCLQLVNILVDL